MEKIKIYVRVEGESKRHVFIVPSGITLEALLDRYGDTMGIEQNRIDHVRAAVFTPLGEPLGQFKIVDGAEVLILKDPYRDEIIYEGTE